MKAWPQKWETNNMQRINRHMPFICVALMLGCLVFALYPFYRFYIDTDATAYLAIAQRYADGDILKAVNGYWSPFACWVTAGFIKGGLLPFAAAIVTNTIAAMCFLWISNSFFLLLVTGRPLHWIFSITVGLFLSYAVFKQSFDDLWECFFLLAALRILLSRQFVQRWDLWVWMGICGGFAYYAKAYAFPFFILNTVCCTFLVTKAWEKDNRKTWLRISGIAVFTMVLMALPWIYMLKQKYGIWMTSTAGTLNLSWYPVGHPYYKVGIQHLLPPVYPDSPSYWEDPWMVNGPAPHFWNTWSLFLRQVARGGYNVFLLVKCLGEISVFLIPTAGLAIAMTFSRKIRAYFEERQFIVAVSFLLFPAGFLLINFEARYIWYMLLPGMLLCIAGLQFITRHSAVRLRYLTLTLALSFLVFPLWDMKILFMEGRQEYEMAERLKQLGIRGSFTANVVFGKNDDLERVSRVAYFSGNPYYNMPYLDVPAKELLAELRRYDIKYYFDYHPERDLLLDEHGTPFPEVAKGQFAAFRVFLLRP